MRKYKSSWNAQVIFLEPFSHDPSSISYAMHESILISLTTLFLSCVASPIAQTPSPQDVADQEAKCRAWPSASPIDPTCWNTLKMDTWMQNWNVSTAVCKPREDWGNCFMRLTLPNSPMVVCTQISVPSNCPAPNPGTIVPGPAEIFYGAYSISCKRFAPSRPSIFAY